MKDHCVLCNKETPYDIDTHIDMRHGYVEGVGQLCRTCLMENKDTTGVHVSKFMIESIPNDLELGAKIRQVYNAKR